MSDIISQLHTTPAFEAAVFELLVSEANWIAVQLEFTGRIELKTADREGWSGGTGPRGLHGTVCSEDYSFSFLQGALRTLRKIDWMARANPPGGDWSDMAGRLSLLDAQGARELARFWLQRLGIDVQEFEDKFPPRVAQARNAPFYILHWGAPRMPLAMQILGTTKELVGLEINHPATWKRPLLELKNAAELLGSPPPARHFLQERMGRNAFDIIENADAVSIWLLTSSQHERRKPKIERTAPLELNSQQARQFSDILLSFESYLWDCQKMCMPDYGARLRYHKEGDFVDCSLCYECDIVEVVYRGQPKDHDLQGSVHNALVRAIQPIFPEDEVIQSLKMYPERK